MGKLYDTPQDLIFRPNSAVVNLTDSCNFSCPYCFVAQNPRRSSIEVLRATCNFLLKDAKEKPSLWFFGGEPLLELNSLIKPILEEYGDRLDWGITTNGSLLDEDTVDFLFKYDVGILLSIDGTQKVQDYQRPAKKGSSFEQVVKNIPYLLLKYPNTMFRATLTKFSIPFMNETYDFARHMGFKTISFVINEGEEYTEDDYKELVSQYEDISLKIIKGSPLWLSDIDKAAQWNIPQIHTCYRCGYGTTSMGVTVEGNIVPCQELSSIDWAIIGDVFNGIDKTKHEAFLEKANKTPIIPKGLTPQEQRMIFNGTCPKHQYFNNNFEITHGRAIQLRAMAVLYNRLHRLTKCSGNPYYRRLSSFENP